MSDERRDWASQRAMSWVIDDAPVPPNLFQVLMVIARRCDERGKGSYQSVSTIVEKTGKSEDQVKKDIRDLSKLGLLLTGDQSLAAHIPVWKRPKVYDVPLHVSGPKPVKEGRNRKGVNREGGCMDTPGGTSTPPCMDATGRGGMDTPGRGGTGTPLTKPLKNPKNNPSSPYPLVVTGEVVDGEIVEEGEESTSSVEHQVQKLTDEARAAKPNWSAVEIRQQINALTVTFNGDIDIIGAVVRGTAQDPASAKPSRMTASGNPALVAASQALMLHRLDTSDAAFAPAPLRKGAHVFTPDGSGISCAVERCGLPKANGIHVSAESWAARNANAGHPRPHRPNQHVPHLDREDISAYKTSKLYP